jgi:hypothetical protein
LLRVAGRCKNHGMEADDDQLRLQRLTAVWQLSHVLDDSLPHEIVTLTSSIDPRTGNFTATATRTWVSDLDGSGLEADQMDPVLILERPPGNSTLEEFHSRALAELEVRRHVDYEVADLFVCDP